MTWLDVLCAVVWRFGGSVLGHPSEVARDGREACPEWLATGWPATGHGLVNLLTGAAEELLTVGLLVCHTEPGPGQPEWIAVSDLSAPPKALHRLDPASLVPTTPAWGGRRSDWPTRWSPKTQPRRDDT